MSRRRSREELRNISQLDVTPLVDLTFLLLIVFMITAPALEYAVDVSPPAYNATEIKPKEHKVITLTNSGSCLMADQSYSQEQLRAALASLHLQKPKLEVYIRADKRRPYGEVMDLMRLVQNVGFQEVSLITQDEDR